MSRTSLRLIKGSATRERCVALRLQGKTFEQIGAAVGVAPQVAHRHVMRALREAAERTAEATDTLRDIERQRLEAMHDAVWPSVLAGDLASVAVCIRIAERRARLLGLDAPVKVEAEGVSFVQVLQQVAARLDGPPEPE